MKVVVTGGTGFLGSHLVDALVEQGHQVVCAVRDPARPGHLEAAGVPRVAMRELLSDDFDLAGTDALFHLAAIRHRWGASEADYQASNVELTRRLLDRCQGPVEQFIYCSSIAVFGWPGRGPIDETFPYDPINSYGRTKVECERMVFERQHEGRIRGTVVRPSIVYGRRDPTGMLTKLATMLERGIYRTVGSGENRVQLAHVADVVQGFLRVLGNPAAFGRGYIVTSRSPVRINRLVELVAQGLGKPAPRWRIPRPVALLAALTLEGLYAAGLRVTGPEPMIAREKIQVMTTDRHYSIARAEDELGYAPAFDYPEGVADFLAGLRRDGLLAPAAAAGGGRGERGPIRIPAE